MKVTVFTLADKEYGVDISQVREVIRMKEITPVPDTAGFVEGVISLRGRVIPIINLRKKLGLEEKPITSANRIIISRLDSHFVGVVVDSVTDVISIEEEDITPPDEVLKKARYLVGVCKLGERLILVADMEKLLSDKDRATIGKVEKRVEVRKKVKK